MLAALGGPTVVVFGVWRKHASLERLYEAESDAHDYARSESLPGRECVVRVNVLHRRQER